MVKYVSQILARGDVRDGLELATKDVDADVRGCARRALAGRL